MRPCSPCWKAARSIAAVPGAHTKNLFLKDASGQFYLVTVLAEKQVDLGALRHMVGAGRFSFGSADEMVELLGITPGSVTPLAAINDTRRQGAAGAGRSAGRAAARERASVAQHGDLGAVRARSGAAAGALAARAADRAGALEEPRPTTTKMRVGAGTCAAVFDQIMTTVATSPLIDSFARQISYVRLSVTDRCDLRCTYCMPERMQFLPKAEVLSLEELHRLALAFIARGVRKIRLTGGEPLVRRDVMTLVQRLGRELGNGLDELTLTTNGTQLHASRAGTGRCRGSADQRFARYARPRTVRQARRGAMRWLRCSKGLDAADRAGLKVKLNTVALKGLNEDEIPSLIGWAHGRGFDVTLIEVMPLGEVEEDRFDHYLPLTAVRDTLEQRWTLTESPHASGGPARYVDVAETGGRLGFITPLTNNFCAGCNRVRVTATGQIYMCLGQNDRVDLRAALRGDDSDAALDAALDRAIRRKPERHDFHIDAPGAAPALSRHMSMTGG